MSGGTRRNMNVLNPSPIPDHEDDSFLEAPTRDQAVATAPYTKGMENTRTSIKLPSRVRWHAVPVSHFGSGKVLQPNVVRMRAVGTFNSSNKAIVGPQDKPTPFIDAWSQAANPWSTAPSWYRKRVPTNWFSPTQIAHLATREFLDGRSQ